MPVPTIVPKAIAPKSQSRKKSGIVEDWLRSEIESGRLREGERLPSEQDLARRFGIANMTVRAGLEPLVRRGVLRRVNGVGTFVGEKQKHVAVKTIALVVPRLRFFWSARSKYFPRVAEGLFMEAQRNDLNTVLVEHAQNPMLSNPFSYEQYDGVICLLVDSDCLRVLDGVQRSGVPAVAMNLYQSNPQMPFVSAQQRAGAARTVAHLVELGHHQIAFLPGSPGNLDIAERRRGFLEAMEALGGEVVPFDGIVDGFYEEHGFAAASAMLDGKVRPTAIVAANDSLAAGAIQAAGARGLSVPGDLSVTGFGDSDYARHVEPSLTTVHLPLEEMGKAAIQSLAQMMAGQGDPEPVLLKTELIRRESTGPCS